MTEKITRFIPIMYNSSFSNDKKAKHYKDKHKPG